MLHFQGNELQFSINDQRFRVLNSFSSVNFKSLNLQVALLHNACLPNDTSE